MQISARGLVVGMADGKERPGSVGTASPRGCVRAGPH